jgi:hypothetical protein
MWHYELSFFLFVECVVYFLACERLFWTHWNQEQEQHKNVLDTLKPRTGTTQKQKRPHDKKYTTHSKEKKTQSIMPHSRMQEETHVLKTRKLKMLYINSTKNKTENLGR